MSKKLEYAFVLYKSTNMQNMLIDAVDLNRKLFSNELRELCIKDYKYTPDEAIKELDLDVELINHLVEDYVIQIVKSCIALGTDLKNLKLKRDNGLELDYTSIRELAHKNLGVAKNLRIHTAEILLTRIMKEDDLDLIFFCIEGLFACATILKPQEAFDTLRLIKIKNSF